MIDDVEAEANRVFAMWTAAEKDGGSAQVSDALDALLLFLRRHPPSVDRRTWGLIAITAVQGLLARGRTNRTMDDVVAAANLAEAVWRIPEVNPVPAVWPTISTLIAIEDRLTPEGLGRWANVQMLELALDRDPDRRAHRLSGFAWLETTLRQSALMHSDSHADSRLRIRFARDVIDSLPVDDPARRFAWLGVALAWAARSANAADSDPEHHAAVWAYEEATRRSAHVGEPLWDFDFGFAAASVALQLSAARRTADVKRALIATRRFIEAIRNVDISAETRAKFFQNFSPSLEVDDPELLEEQLLLVRSMLGEDLDAVTRESAAGSLLRVLIRAAIHESSNRARRELRAVARMLLDTYGADPTGIRIGALMLSVRGVHDAEVVAEVVEMLRPPPDAEVPWTTLSAFGRVLVQQARLLDDPAIAHEVLGVADRLDRFEDQAPHMPRELRSGALKVMALSGDAEAAIELVELVGQSADPVVELFRLNLRPDSPSSAEDLGHAFVQIAREAGRGSESGHPLTMLVIDMARAHARLSDLKVIPRLAGISDPAAVINAAFEAWDDDRAKALLAAELADANEYFDESRRANFRDHSIELLRTLVDGDPELTVLLGGLLFERHQTLRNLGDLHEAAAVLLSPDPQEDRTAGHRVLLVQVIESMDKTDLSAKERGDLRWRRVLLLQDSTYDTAAPIEIRLESAKRLMSATPLVWPYVLSIASSVTESLTVDSIIDSSTGTTALNHAQGVTARGAYAAAMSGDLARAIEMAERGQGLLAAAALRRHGAASADVALREPVLHRRWVEAGRELADAMRQHLGVSAGTFTLSATPVGGGVASEPPTRKFDRQEYLRDLAERSPDIAAHLDRERQMRSDLEAVTGAIVADPELSALVAHLQEAGARLCYVLATPWGGTGLTIEASGGLRAVDLPELTEQRGVEWISAINNDAMWSVEEPRNAVRGAAPEPSVRSTGEVLAAMASAVQPLADALASSSTPVQLVPMGSLASLPLTAALQIARGDEEWLDMAVAASGRLHVSSTIRASITDTHTGFVAVTDARPSQRRDGQLLPALPHAAAEGGYLVSARAAEHFTGSAATVRAALHGFLDHSRVVHLAVHGDVDLENPEQSCLYLVDDEKRPAWLTAADLATSLIDARLVFLGACWTGLPGQRLPDEAIGFPTILLQSGAGGVVAPQWPIDDRAAYTFAVTFYEGWVDQGLTAGRALSAAMRRTREEHTDTPTWAAFSLHGT